MCLVLSLLFLVACRGDVPPSGDATPVVAAESGGKTDSAFAAVQTRAAAVMGVDQARSTHVFVDESDGGRIVYTANDGSDTIAGRQIREHLRAVALAFAVGDFSQPAEVHGREVPGASTLAARRALVRYDVTDRTAGAALRVTTRDTLALAAVRVFLQFQRDDHRAAAHERHDGPMDHAAHMSATTRQGGRIP